MKKIDEIMTNFMKIYPSSFFAFECLNADAAESLYNPVRPVRHLEQFVLCNDDICYVTDHQRC